MESSALRRTAAHVFVDDLVGLDLTDRDTHHLSRVLRLRAGEAVGASDGRGGWVPCAWTGAGLEPVDEPTRVDRPEPLVSVAFAVPKGDRGDWAVQKLTEVGADRIVALHAERSVVRWTPDRAGRARDRWAAVAREAAMQSRRTWLPEILPPLTPAQALASLAPAGLAEPGGSPPSLDRPAVLVGPEGGWSPAELDSAPASVDLGPGVLRTETAAVAAAVLLIALRTGNVREA